MKRMLLILNPGSGAGTGRRRWDDWMRGLRGADVAFDCVKTTAPDDARRHAAECGEVDAVVAVGGDGTINGVLNGLMERGEPRPALGVLYAGTSPDFCRFHGLPVEPRAALEALCRGRERRVDVVRISYGASDGQRTAFFGCSANVGIGAGVAERANRWRPLLGDTAGTALAALASLPGPHPDMTVGVDDDAPLVLRRCCNLTIAKNPFLASGLRFDDARSPDDGRLSLLGVHGRGLAGLLALLPAFYTGRVSARRGVLHRACRRVTVTCDAPCAVEFDGDPRGRLPVTAEVAPKALRLITRESAP